LAIQDDAGCTLEQIGLHGFPAYRLGNGLIETIVIPTLGAKVASLRNLRRGREWLWLSPHLPFKVPVYDTSYIEEFDFPYRLERCISLKADRPILRLT